MMSEVTVWWISLSIVSATNFVVWLVSTVIVVRNKHRNHPDIYRRQQVMIWLSGVYVTVCAFRSFLPRIDVERICLVDTWLSTIFVGRSVATVAELCFIAQCAILLHLIGKRFNNHFAVTVSILLLPLIFIAECFSWYAALSTNYFGSVIEESIWLICGVLLVVSLLLLWPHVSRFQRSFIAVTTSFGVGFIIFMLTVDVPMYWSRWQADTVAGIQYLSVVQGIEESLSNCTVSFNSDLWRDEIAWMTLYFTVAVWVSISFIYAVPSFSTEKDEGGKFSQTGV